MGPIAGPETEVRPAESADDLEAAAEALALAFADDPCWAHLLREDETRAEKLLAYFTSEIESLVPEYRQVWVTEDGGGAAIWAPPGRWRVPMGRTLSETPAMLKVFGRRFALGLRALIRLEGHHPKSPDHWYLHYLGVEPRRQGRGLGGALLRPVLGACDSERIPAHLEASTDRNRKLYERHGFALTEVFDMPGRGGPPIREMWRDPAPGEVG
jgi:GNAT superfamily N-acetyltransferase